MKVEHRPGRLHTNADGVSRILCTQCDRSDETSKHSVKAVGRSDPENLDLKSLQEEYRDILLIRSWLEKGARPEPADISSESNVMKTLLEQLKKLEVHDGMVVRRYETSDPVDKKVMIRSRYNRISYPALNTKPTVKTALK